MSEKRFEVSFDGKKILDIYAVKNNKEYDIKQACDLINSLVEENKHLKVQNELLIEENKECKALIEKRYGKYLKEKFARKEE